MWPDPDLIPNSTEPSSNISDEEEYKERETLPMVVPITILKNRAGAVIGTGGSRIKKIKFISKAKILTNRDENVEESDEQIFTIIGNRRQIQTAQFLITFCQNLPQSVDFEDFDYCPETGRMLYQRGLYHGIKETIAWKLIVGNDTKIINLSSLV